MKRTRIRSDRTRQPAPANVSFGGLAVSGGSRPVPEFGQAGIGEGVRRPARNTMAKSQHGGMPITYYAPMERWQPTTEKTSVHAPARTAAKRFDPATRDADGSASVGEGIRQAAMTRHSILRTTGAIDVQPYIGPIWAGDTN